MVNWLWILVITLVAVPTSNARPLHIVATTAMIAEPLTQIVGKKATVTTLIKSGLDPHSYRPTRSDIATLSTADAIIWTSHQLEPRFKKPIGRLARHIPTLYLVEHFSPKELIAHGKATDPHLWMDPNLWHKALGLSVEFTAQLDPANARLYRRNLQGYGARLQALDESIARLLQPVPTHQRVLITSHDAFGYFARRYGWEVQSLLGISTESEMSLATVERLVEFISRNHIPAVFSETAVPAKYLEALKQGVASRGKQLVIGGPLYADSLAATGKAATYEGMLWANSCHIATTMNPSMDTAMNPERVQPAQYPKGMTQPFGIQPASRMEC